MMLTYLTVPHLAALALALACVLLIATHRYVRPIPMVGRLEPLLGALAAFLGAVFLFWRPKSDKPDGASSSPGDTADVENTTSTPWKVTAPHDKPPDNIDDIANTHALVDAAHPHVDYDDDDDLLANFREGARDDGLIAEEED